MPSRNTSPQRMFLQMAAEHKPTFRFEGKTREDWLQWRKTALPEVMKCLGDFPERVPLNPELTAEWEQDGLIKQRWLIDVSKNLSVVCVVNRPKGLASGQKLPAIHCWHGHGNYGKEPVMGNDSSDGMRADIRNMNYDYGRQMAEAGYVTYGVDWLGKGDLDDSGKPHHFAVKAGRDWCNLYYLHATMFGMTSISINVAIGMAATDFVLGLPFVEEDRLGVMGLSGGGTMTLWSSLCDDRYGASEIMCYSDLWEAFGFRDVNYCGMQVAPGLYKLVDLPDLQGLLAPRPLLVDIGIYDTCFLIDTSRQCYEQVERIYAAADALENLELDMFPGEHAWGGNGSMGFFGKHL